MISYIETRIGNLWEIEKVEYPYIWLKGSKPKIHCDKHCEPGWFYNGKVYPPEVILELNLIPDHKPLPDEILVGLNPEVDDLTDDFILIEKGSWIHGHKMDTRKSIIQHTPSGSYLSVEQDRSGDEWRGFEYSAISIKQVFKSYELKEVYKE